MQHSDLYANKAIYILGLFSEFQITVCSNLIIQMDFIVP